MSNTLLGLFSNPFTDLLGNPKFWLGVGAIVILCVLIFICIKYPKAGLPVLGGVIALGLVCLDVYCVLQINYYYNAKGGIYGVLTGLLETNKVEVVDNLTFEVKNIELTESSTGVYSASITTDQVLSLDTKQSLGIFINGMPCDTTSEVHSDFAYAEYPYTFYDNDKTAVCTDTLILNIAFYENSTYLNLSTKGGTLPVEECVKYWHHYFNKNGFIVKVAPFDNVSADLGYSKGDISNYAIVNYYVNDELYSVECYPVGYTLTLQDYDSENFIGWYVDDDTYFYKSIMLNTNINFYAKFGDESTAHEITFNSRNNVVTLKYFEGQAITPPRASDINGCTFVGWENEDFIVDFNNYVVTEDETFYALYSENIYVNKTKSFSPSEIQNGIIVDLDDYFAFGDRDILEYNSFVLDIWIEMFYPDPDDGDVLDPDFIIEQFEISNEDKYIVYTTNLGSNPLSVSFLEGNLLYINSDKKFVPSDTSISYTIFFREIDLISR